MKISDHRQLRKVREKFIDAARRAAVFLDTGVFAICCLVRNRVFDDVDVAAIAITKQKSETLPLVDLDRGHQQSPKCVRRYVNVHEEYFLRFRREPRLMRIVASRRGVWKWTFY